MIICTTSDRYHHLLPIFFFLYSKYWNEPFTLLGYTKPTCELPDNCTWYSMGEDKGPNDWSTGIRAFVEKMDADFFVWLMEDQLIKSPVDDTAAWALCMPKTGRVNLTNDVSKREHSDYGLGVLLADPNSRYRLSMQPSIWNKKYFLQYVTDGLDPWTTETQDPKNDGWDVFGLVNYPVNSNEGVTKRDIYKLNLDGVSQEDIEHIKTIAEWMK